MIESVLMAGVVDTASILASWPPMQEFYLSGGTALALQQGHRQSRDLDFFTQRPLSTLPDLPGMDGMLKSFAQVEWTQKSPDQIHWRLDGVSVTLLAYPFSHDFGFRAWRGLAVADVHDIAVQKAYTVGRRANARDYIDLHAVLTAGVVSLDALIGRAQNAYGEAFSPRLFLQQLTYTRDLPDRDDAIGLLIEPESFDVIAQDLQTMVRDWVEQYAQVHPRPRGGRRP